VFVPVRDNDDDVQMLKDAVLQTWENLQDDLTIPGTINFATDWRCFINKEWLVTDTMDLFLREAIGRIKESRCDSPHLPQRPEPH